MPLWYLLIPYTLLIMTILILALVNLWHLVAFSHDVLAYVTATIGVIGFFVIVLVSARTIIGIDWQATIDVVKLIPFLS